MHVQEQPKECIIFFIFRIFTLSSISCKNAKDSVIECGAVGYRPENWAMSKNTVSLQNVDIVKMEKIS